MIPDVESGKRCSGIIQHLAEKYQSVPFPPHITLADIPGWPTANIKEAIQNIAVDTTPITVYTKNVRCKSAPYQKITLEVEKNDKLNDMHHKTDRVFEGNYSKKEYPHLSLLYSEKPCSELQYALHEIRTRDVQKISTDQLAFVHCKGTPEEWRTLYVWKLNRNKSLI